METLSGHWDKTPEGWRKSVRAGCEALRQAILSDGCYQPGSLQQFLVGALFWWNEHATGGRNALSTLEIYIPLVSEV